MSVIIVDCFPSFNDYFQVSVKDSFEILTDTIVDRNTTYYFINKFNKNDTIYGNAPEWHSTTRMLFYAYNKPSYISYGHWLSINSAHYLGFRFSKNGAGNCGWIKFKNDHRLTITEYVYIK